MPCHVRYAVAHSLLCHSLHCLTAPLPFTPCALLCRALVAPVRSHLGTSYHATGCACHVFSDSIRFMAYLECATAYPPLPVISRAMPCRSRGRLISPSNAICLKSRLTSIAKSLLQLQLPYQLSNFGCLFDTLGYAFHYFCYIHNLLNF